MTFFEALLLGIVQGATAFPLVSSSSHRVMGPGILGVELPGIFFEVAVDVATILSVLRVEAVFASPAAEGWALPGISRSGSAGVAALAVAWVGGLAIRAFVAMLRNRSFPAVALFCAAAGSTFLPWLRLS